jgi:hypothetical protein
VRHFGKDTVVLVDKRSKVLGSHCFASWREGSEVRSVEQIRFQAGSEVAEIEDFACTECGFGRMTLPRTVQKMGLRAFGTTCHVTVVGDGWREWNRRRLEVPDSGEPPKT